ncbi:MAG: hypothetical protein MUF80_08335 [Burkholderiales bacterium]|jgi:hypothetical protein|nr:hypothetical protein [Burkholderiales bacterium]
MALAILALAGCAGFYSPAPDAITASLNVKSVPTPWICVDGKRQLLSKDTSGYAPIPAGGRVTVGSSFYNYVYQGVSTSCSARSSLVPVPGQKYYLDFEIEAERCTALVFKEDPSSRTGLALESTLRPSSECSYR